MRTLYGILTLSLCLPLAAQKPQTNPAGYELLFQRTEHLLQSESLCETDSCHQAFQDLAADLHKGRGHLETGNMNGEIKAQWHRQLGNDLQQVVGELDAVAKKHEVAFEKIPTKACKRDAYYTCDQVFNIATGICSVYAFVGNLYAAAICEGATIYGYNNCVAQNG
jgi:hypothetical protein